MSCVFCGWQQSGSRRSLLRRCLALGVAVGIDLLWGELPMQVHPVVWMGKLIKAEERRLPQQGPRRQLAAGTALVCANTVLAGLAGKLVSWFLSLLPGWLGVTGEGAILSTLFSIRMLRDEAHRCCQLVEADDLPRARAALRSLVSRDTTALDAPLLLAAAAESVAENTCDSVVAPLLAYLVAGWPGAACYRIANTMDAMLGYRGRYEYLGKAAARYDDLLNWIPARATAALFVLAAPLAGGSARSAWRVAWRDHRRTASPNAGWPMSTAAGALRVRLEKRGHYVLGEALPPASPASVRGAIRLLNVSVALLVGLGALLGLAGSLAQRARRQERAC